MPLRICHRIALASLAFLITTSGCTTANWSYEHITVGGTWQENRQYVPRDGQLRSVANVLYRDDSSRAEELLFITLSPAQVITGKYALTMRHARSVTEAAGVEFRAEIDREATGLQEVAQQDLLYALAAEFAFSTSDAYRKEAAQLIGLAILRTAQALQPAEEIELFEELQPHAPRVPTGGTASISPLEGDHVQFGYRTFTEKQWRFPSFGGGNGN